MNETRVPFHCITVNATVIQDKITMAHITALFLYPVQV